MIEIVICDDFAEDLKHTIEILNKVLSEQQIEYAVKGFLSANELLGNIKRADIGVLDIAMEEQDGIELGIKLKERFPNIQLIYTTSYEQYVLQAINDAHAYAFLRKPVDADKMKDQFAGIIGRLSVKKSVERDFLKVSDEAGKKYPILRLNLEDIIYFEYMKSTRKIAIILADRVYKYTYVMEHLVRELKDEGFAVNCRGFLVNISHITKIKGYEVIMDNGAILALSQKRAIDFKKELIDVLQNNVE